MIVRLSVRSNPCCNSFWFCHTRSLKVVPLNSALTSDLTLRNKCFLSGKACHNISAYRSIACSSCLHHWFSCFSCSSCRSVNDITLLPLSLGSFSVLKRALCSAQNSGYSCRKTNISVLSKDLEVIAKRSWAFGLRETGVG